MDKDLLKNSILFRGMTDEELTAALLALDSNEKTYKKGSLIMYSGCVTDRMGMVLSGSVTIESNDIWGNCTILSHVGKGQFFAETYAVLPDEVMLVDVKANEDCTVLFLRTAHLLEHDNTPPWMEKFMKNMLMLSFHKNLTLSGRSFHTSPKSCRGRLLSYLNSVSVKKHSLEFDIPFDRQQLADYLNLERTNMSKELSRMQKEGMIEYRKNHFRLIDINL